MFKPISYGAFCTPRSPFARVYSLCAIEAYSPENRDMDGLKDGEKSESTTNDLDDTWHMEDNEGNTKYFEDEMWVRSKLINTSEKR